MRTKPTCLLSFLLLLVTAAAAAFQLQPMSASIDPRASGTVTFEVRNTTAAPIAVQMRATTRTIQRDGTELNEDASDQIQLFPSQLIVRPGQVQTVRARWLGDRALDAERPFRIIAEQVPINFGGPDEQTGGVRMMLRYRATLYVTPPTAERDVVVNNLVVDADSITFEIENRGTAHALIPESMVVVVGNGRREEIAASEIEPLTTINVLPGGVRFVEIPRGVLPLAPEELLFRFAR